MNAFNTNNNFFCHLFLIFHLLIQSAETPEDFIFPTMRHFLSFWEESAGSQILLSPTKLWPADAEQASPATT